MSLPVVLRSSNSLNKCINNKIFCSLWCIRLLSIRRRVVLFTLWKTPIRGYQNELYILRLSFNGIFCSSLCIRILSIKRKSCYCLRHGTLPLGAPRIPFKRFAVNSIIYNWLSINAGAFRHICWYLFKQTKTYRGEQKNKGQWGRVKK